MIAKLFPILLSILPLLLKYQDAVETYREENDWMGQFLSECCDLGSSLIEKSGELYKAYRTYCIENNEYIRSTTDFYSSLDSRGFGRHKMKSGVKIYGLKLKIGQEFLA